MNDACTNAIAIGGFYGALVADAVAMPVHWYYNQQSLQQDYGLIEGYLAPKSPHADSILWRSSYTPLNEQGDILREQSQYWGQRGIHYHQFLKAGENTLNSRLAIELAAMIRAEGGYDPSRWLERYVAFMLTPGKHRDTYVEEYHRHFFTNYAAGKKPLACGGDDVHIGGLALVPALVAALGPSHPDLRAIVQTHVGLTHKNEGVLRAADVLVRLLVRVATGETSELRAAILEEASDWISAAKIRQWQKHPDGMVVGGILSSACYIPDAFPAALYLVYRHAGDFAEGVCSNAQVGGDNCHRGAVVGSLLGASAVIPQRFLDGLDAGATVLPFGLFSV